jgi:hypothetical protein
MTSVGTLVSDCAAAADDTSDPRSNRRMRERDERMLFPLVVRAVTAALAECA